MIKTVSEMLLAFMKAESKALADYDLKHAPSIGNMYEGLSSKILDSAVPPGLDLRVVDGFIVDAQGNMSGQIDCMLVTGEGEQIPYTKSYKWPIWDVLAVIEVKKNLYGAELADSFHHLRQVAESFSNWLFTEGGEKRSFSLAPAMRAFSTITGVHAPRYADRESLPEPLQLIYHTLVSEQITPILIVFGYNGYKSETGLREGLYGFLKDRDSGKGYGVPSFPHQITCNGNSLVKLTGQPYMAPMEGDYWTFYGSTKSNPLWVMIELIWTKIANRFCIGMPWGEDLDVEVIHRLIEAKAVVENGQGGWMLNYTSMSGEDDVSIHQEAWTPVFVSDTQFVIFNQLCNKEGVDITEPAFVEYISKKEKSVEAFVADLQKTGLVSLDGTTLRLTTAELMCGIFPEGGFAVGENNTGRMTRYMHRKMHEKQA
ncbi:DUF6602 domain-containing protein [Zoogloea sp.]|uniref:DUF6602 domain-containing protein n=1 Tax=Zoogloea sp. TaxID=49181 RepID=UPI0025D61D9F|nr:DUF6602 domain-containing protein [Zoogloea sp.]MCK6395778.1 hypothetical protein [Zoogloea sp.]